MQIVSIRIDKKALINELRAMNDNYIKLEIDIDDLTTITLKDSRKIITTRTKQ